MNKIVFSLTSLSLLNWFNCVWGGSHTIVHYLAVFNCWSNKSTLDEFLRAEEFEFTSEETQYFQYTLQKVVMYYQCEHGEWCQWDGSGGMKLKYCNIIWTTKNVKTSSYRKSCTYLSFLYTLKRDCFAL